MKYLLLSLKSNFQNFKYGIVCIPLVLPISAIDKAPTYATGQLISQKNPVQRISGQFVNKQTSKMRLLTEIYIHP